MEWLKLLVAGLLSALHYLRDSPAGPSAELVQCRADVSSLLERVAWYERLCQVLLFVIVTLAVVLKRSRTLVVGKPCPSFELNLDNRVQHHSVSVNSSSPSVEGGALSDLVLDQSVVLTDGKPKLAEGFVLTPSAKRKLALRA